ncbi:hypothetical protein C8R21_13237 [Nitrosospira multiformis]|uniref:Uncharacterized protein n=1 Tax=Nitrosospira multiformis TaxID=1231 RepID=A0A2T5I5X6_9PROT|nr:hypothetical protein C8R21_13237 [Nitrosospira multiformis]
MPCHHLFVTALVPKSNWLSGDSKPKIKCFNVRLCLSRIVGYVIIDPSCARPRLPTRQVSGREGGSYVLGNGFLKIIKQLRYMVESILEDKHVGKKY